MERAQLVKTILRTTLWGVIFSGIIFLFVFAQKKENDLLCNRLNISIAQNSLKENFLVEDQQIRELIARRFGQVENTPLKGIDVNRIERIIYTNPWVASANAYLTINGILNIEIEQRTPIIRIINEAGESYFIDSTGRTMPWSSNYTPRTLIASGHINERFEQSKKLKMDEVINNDTLKTHTRLDDLYTMAKLILADEFWSAYVEQIYVNRNNEIELVPKVGKHKIIFGNSDDMIERFWKLKLFYTEGLNHTGWTSCDTLNLKFRNQVVCTKPLTKGVTQRNSNTFSKY